MSVGYPDEGAFDDAARTALRGPAPGASRRRNRTLRGPRSGVRGWMILAPISLVALAGASAALLTGGEEPPPSQLAEPAALEPAFPGAVPAYSSVER